MTTQQQSPLTPHIKDIDLFGESAAQPAFLARGIVSATIEEGRHPERDWQAYCLRQQLV